MMSWLLVGILISGQQIMVKPFGFFPEMEHCFEAREFVMQTAPQPKVNYEFVCIRTDNGENV